MAIDLGTAYIQIQPSTKGLIPALKKEMGGFSTVAKDAGEAGGKELSDGIGDSLKAETPKLGGVLKAGLIGLAAGVGLAAGKAIMDGISGAAELEQSRGGLSTVFEKDTALMNKQAEEAYKNLGMSEDQYNKLATASGAYFKGQQMDAAKFTTDLIERGGDISATFGGSTEEAVAAMNSGMRGSYEPLEKYGIVLNETMINQELMARGQDKLTGSALEQAKAQARYDLIMQKSADTQGAFAKESDTMANRQQVMAAQWENLQAKIGEKFLPVITSTMTFIVDEVLPGFEKFIDGLSETGQWIQDNATWLKPLAVGLGTFVGALGAYYAVQKTGAVITKAVAVAQRLWNLALMANPIGLVVAAIAGLVAGLVYFFTQTELGKEIWDKVWNGIKSVAKSVADWFTQTLVPGIAGAWDAIVSGASTAWNTVRDTVMGVVDPLVEGLIKGFQFAKDGIVGIWESIKSALTKPINFIIGTIWNNGLRKALNLIPGVDLKEASLIGEPPRSTSSRAVAAYARGGILPGWSRASQGDDQLIMARRGEGITVSEALDPYEKQRLLALNQAALKGIPAKSFRERFEGHATGGIVGFRGHKFTDTFRNTLLAAEQLAKTTFRISQGGFRPRTSYSGTSHQGDAVDLTPVTGTIVRALRQAGVAAWDRTGKGNWAPHIHGVPLPGYGRGAGSAVWQAQDYLRGGDGLGGRDNGPKVAVNRAATSLGPYADDGNGGNLLDVLPKVWKAATDGLKELTGPWGDLFKTGMADVLSSAFDWAVEKIPGLKQVMDFFGNRVGKITTDEDRKGPPNMRGYATGTSNAVRGPAWVGENGPEIVNFRGGEQVYTAEQSAAMTAPIHIENINLPGINTFRELAEFVEELPESRRHGHMIGA